MLDPALEHITILTGASRLSYRSEVRAEIIDHVRAKLASDGNIGAGWTVKLLKTKVDQIWVYDLFHDAKHIVRCFLCANAADSEAVWLLASQIGSLPGTRLHPPQQLPWLAVAIANAPVIMGDPTMFADVLSEAGDLERCVAWALLE